MQIGGSDQYGNITAGIDAVKYIAANHPAPDVPKKTTKPPFGLTAPLLTTSSGAKFGKSAGNAIWLDHEMTSTFDLYGYFLRTSDEDVERYLKLFTFKPIEEINALVTKHMENPSQRIAQHTLASEFVELVHGKDEAKSVQSQHELMFKKPIRLSGAADHSVSAEIDPVGVNALKLPQVNVNNKPKAHLTLPRTLIETKSIGKILYACGLAESSSEGHRLASMQSVHIGGPPSGKKMSMSDASLTFAPIKLWKPEETKKYLIEDSMLILRRGKHNIRIIEVVEDEEYEKLGLKYPGQGTGWNQRDSEEPIESTPQRKDLGHNTDAKAETGFQKHAKEVKFAEELQRSAEAHWSPVLDEEESWPEYHSPEDRVESLRAELRAEEQERQRKIALKNAPKGKFMGHGKPRGPIPRQYDF